MTEPDYEREYREKAWEHFSSSMFHTNSYDSFMAGFDAARVFYTEGYGESIQR